MGRGDKRTKKGKIFAGSFGVSRVKRVPVDITPKKTKKKAKKK